MLLNGNGPYETTRLRDILFLAKEAWNTFGLPTIMLVVILLLYTGVIPSPLVEANSLIKQHIEVMQKHIEHDNEIIFYLKSMCISNATLAKTPIEDCLWRN
jgi:hypothetical protein